MLCDSSKTFSSKRYAEFSAGSFAAVDVAGKSLCLPKLQMEQHNRICWQGDNSGGWLSRDASNSLHTPSPPPAALGALSCPCHPRGLPCRACPCHEGPPRCHRCSPPLHLQQPSRSPGAHRLALEPSSGSLMELPLYTQASLRPKPSSKMQRDTILDFWL